MGRHVTKLTASEKNFNHFLPPTEGVISAVNPHVYISRGDSCSRLSAVWRCALCNKTEKSACDSNYRGILIFCNSFFQ